jgi:hypothetical protein
MLFFPHNEDRDSTGIIAFDAGVLSNDGICKLIRDMYKRIYGIGDQGIELIKILYNNSFEPDNKYADQSPRVKLTQETKNNIRNELGISLDSLNTQIKSLRQVDAIRPVRKGGHTTYMIRVPRPDIFDNDARVDGVQINFMRP